MSNRANVGTWEGGKVATAARAALIDETHAAQQQARRAASVNTTDPAELVRQAEALQAAAARLLRLAAERRTLTYIGLAADEAREEAAGAALLEQRQRDEWDPIVGVLVILFGVVLVLVVAAVAMGIAGR